MINSRVGFASWAILGFAVYFKDSRIAAEIGLADGVSE